MEVKFYIKNLTTNKNRAIYRKFRVKLFAHSFKGLVPGAEGDLPGARGADLGRAEAERPRRLRALPRRHRPALP